MDGSKNADMRIVVDYSQPQDQIESIAVKNAA